MELLGLETLPSKGWRNVPGLSGVGPLCLWMFSFCLVSVIRCRLSAIKESVTHKTMSMGDYKRQSSELCLYGNKICDSISKIIKIARTKKYRFTDLYHVDQPRNTLT